jgi:hypothetical protein
MVTRNHQAINIVRFLYSLRCDRVECVFVHPLDQLKDVLRVGGRWICHFFQHRLIAVTVCSGNVHEGLKVRSSGKNLGHITSFNLRN